MTLWTLIPTCNDPMSIYTLVSFALYSIILVGLTKVGTRRIVLQERQIMQTGKDIIAMRIDIAVMATSIKNIESDACETRNAIAEINRTLIDKLT